MLQLHPLRLVSLQAVGNHLLELCTPERTCQVAGGCCHSGLGDFLRASVHSRHLLRQLLGDEFNWIGCIRYFLEFLSDFVCLQVDIPKRFSVFIFKLSIELPVCT